MPFSFLGSNLAGIARARCVQQLVLRALAEIFETIPYDEFNEAIFKRRLRPIAEQLPCFRNFGPVRGTSPGCGLFCSRLSFLLVTHSNKQRDARARCQRPWPLSRCPELPGSSIGSLQPSAVHASRRHQGDRVETYGGTRLNNWRGRQG